MNFLGWLQAVSALLAGIAAWRLLKRRHRETEKRVSPLLQLPVELIHRISNELSPASRLVLSQICRPLREILHRESSITHISREDRCEFLAAIARQRPDQWVCEVCIRFHRTNTVDTPEKPSLQTCTAGLKRWRQTGYGQRDRLDSRLLRIDHRHVQLALKYSRLKCRNYQDYLNKLLAPYVDSNFETYQWPYKQPNILAVHYSAFPKIVAGDDGIPRFLLLSKWRYEEDQRPLSLPAMGDLRICPHLRLLYGARRGVGHEIGSLRRIIDLYLPGGGANNRRGFYFCCYCPTDLCVTKTPGRLELSAWQDLGSEGSPMDRSWRVHVLDNPLSPRGHPHLSHEPGSVLRLYEKDRSEADRTV
ncbi:hypothetical protein F4805DRAFT_242113 [Annulohypoxylon moriforme]|nr:hypothetical protein F4805DRAFT_242113 [Annulohypoxylon moriforme]